MRYAFLILHYKTREVTEACIDSILDLDRASEIGIFVVDNASGNGSGEALKKRYADRGNVEFLLRTENDGFSRGNNAGFAIVKKLWNPEVLIVTNNDTVFPQKDFCDRIDAVLEQTHADVIGPDILKTATGEHQSPIRRAPMTLSELDAALASSEQVLKNLDRIAFVKQAKNLLVPDAVNEAIKQKLHKKNHGDFDWQKPYENVVPFGACQIFAKSAFADWEKLYAPETTFYFEEDILIHRLQLAGKKVVYDPALSVCHLESASTRAAFFKVKDGLSFKHKNLLAGGRIYRDFLCENETNS